VLVFFFQIHAKLNKGKILLGILTLDPSPTSCLEGKFDSFDELYSYTTISNSSDIFCVVKYLHNSTFGMEVILNWL